VSEAAPRPRQRWPLGRWLLGLWGFGLPLLLGGVLLVAQVAGWREHTSLLSGTSPGSPAALSQGLIYVGAWFGFVILAPIAVLSTVFDSALTRLFDSPGEGDSCVGTPPELGCGLGGERPDEAQ